MSDNVQPASTEAMLNALIDKWRNEAMGLASMLKMMRDRDECRAEGEPAMSRETYAIIEGARMQLDRCVREARELTIPF